jgi:hypothetical protein
MAQNCKYCGEEIKTPGHHCSGKKAYEKGKNDALDGAIKIIKQDGNTQ